MIGEKAKAVKSRGGVERENGGERDSTQERENPTVRETGREAERTPGVLRLS